jgi:cell division ATPase FtsA
MTTANAYPTAAQAIANYFNVPQNAIAKIERWHRCWFVVIHGIGSRFVSVSVIMEYMMTYPRYESSNHVNLANYELQKTIKEQRLDECLQVVEQDFLTRLMVRDFSGDIVVTGLYDTSLLRQLIVTLPHTAVNDLHVFNDRENLIDLTRIYLGRALIAAI